MDRGKRYRWSDYQDLPTGNGTGTGTGGRVIQHAPQSSGHSVIESSTRVSQDEQTAAIAHCSATATRSSQRDYHHHQPAEQSHWSGVRNLLFEASAVPTRLQYVDSQLRRSQSEGPPQQHHTIAQFVPTSATATAAEPTGINHHQETETGLMAAWVGRRRQIQDQQRPEHWFVATKPIVTATAAGSALAVESRAAPTTVHELQPHQSVLTSSSSAVTNNRRVVVVSNSSKGASGGGSSEYQLQFAWPSTVNKSIKKMPESLDGVFQLGQQHHHHHHHQSNNNNNGMEREAAGLSSSNRGREEMYLRQYGGMVTNKHQSEDDGAEAGGEQQQQQQQPASRRRRYKTEYKKNFRPFSLYQYVDGQFCKASATAGGAGSADQPQQPQQQQQQQLEKGDPWYHEVLELRKKAGEYKFRGLGGELMPQHMVDLYAKQMDVWEQVSRRSSLSALSLAATTPRSASSEKASAANTRRSSPAKTAPQSARPGHAQPLLSNSRKENTSSTRSQINSQSAERPRRELSQQRSISADGKTRAKSAKPSKSSSTGANAPNVQVAIRPSLGAIFHPMSKAPARSASVGPERRVPKSNSSASTMRSTPVKGRHNNNTTTANDGANEVPAAVKPVQKNVNNKKPTDEIKENVMMTGDNEGQEDASGPVSLPMEIIPATAVTAEDEEPLPALIKAAPEPTRVKSPEQLLVRSPEPVNWTVPLDTGKTFTVTQNIRGGEGSRPHSELKVSMTVRPSPTPPVVVQTNNSSSETTGNGPTMAAVDDEVKGAASPPPAPANAATLTATRPVKAPDGEEEKQEEEEDESLPVESEPIVDEVVEISQPAAAIPPSVDDAQPIVCEETNYDPLSVTEIQSNGLPPTTTTTDPLSAMTAAKEPEAEKSTTQSTDADATAVTTVPGTTLRCLEDPTPFLFSRPATLMTSPPASAAPSVPAAMPKAPRYRVLEDPSLFQADASFSPSVAQPYKVLEAPSSPKGTAAVSSPGSSSPSSNRTIASDVLEKARTRFDRFWTKKEGEK